MHARVSVFTLGGTIASTGQDGTGVGVTPRLTAEDLVAGVPQLGKVADITAISFRQVPSGELTIHDLLELAMEIRRQVEDGADGVVITQGTDTIEESAFVLDCLVSGDAPVVVTGAMRNPELPGADGPANLLAAVQVAASDAARGLGVCVVFNDEIHAAGFVRKTHTSNPATFRSPLVGPIGWISEGSVHVALRPTLRRRIAVPVEAPARPVALLKVALGADPGLVGAVEAGGYAGLVVEGFGGGHVPPAWVEPLERLAEKIPVVLASRTGSGELLRRTYRFLGSESDLLARGLIGAGALDGLKARLLLTLLLMSGVGREEIAAAFAGD